MDPRRLIAGLLALVAGAGAGQPGADPVLEIVALEDARSLGDGRLEGYLLHPDHEVRRQAALALGRIGRPEVVPALVRALTGDEAGAVRASAAFGLGITEDPLPDDAARALAEALGDASDRVRERVVEALGRRGAPGAAELVSAVLAESVKQPGYAERRENIEIALRRSSWDLARLALFALARIGDDGGDPGDLLPLLGIGTAPRTEWWPAVWTTARLGDPALEPLARAWAGSADPLTRALGLRAVRDAGVVAPDLSHANTMVRVEAMRRAAALAGDGAEIPRSDRLLAAVEGGDRVLRAEALGALAEIPVADSADRLVDLIGDPDPGVRALAARALHRQDPESFWLLLSGWSDRDPLARLLMTRQVGTIRDPRVRNFLLQNGLGDEDPRVRASALTSLAGLEDPELAPTIVEHLAAEDVFERAAAANALRALGAGLTELRSAYHEDRDPFADFRLAAVRAVLALDSGTNRRAFAEAALEDAAWPVRSEAHRFLRREGLEPAPPAPAPALEPDAYAPTVRAPFTPVAWIETRHGEIELELLVADAPRTVLNFMKLARDGFYNGLSFHRVVPNFVVQAGDPRGDMSGGPGYSIRCEVNDRRYLRGTVGMALDGKDTGGSQFFITLLPQPHLNGRYPVFAQVRAGFVVLDRLGPGDRIRRIRIWDGITPPQ